MKNQALIKITLRYLPTLPKNAIFQNPLPLPIEEQIVIVLTMDGSLLFPSSSEIQGVLVPFKSGQGVPGDIVLSHQFQTVAIVLASDWGQKIFVSFCPITVKRGS